MRSTKIKVSNDFSHTPAGRYRDDGPYSGEAFREDILVPALKNYDQVVVDLDDVEGFGSSFLEEAFGGLIRHGHITKSDALKKLVLQTNDVALAEEIKEYIEQGCGQQ